MLMKRAFEDCLGTMGVKNINDIILLQSFSDCGGASALGKLI